MAQYQQGTITVTAGETTVSGIGTAWLANATSGDMLLVGEYGPAAFVGSVVSDTELVLEQAWLGADAVGTAYAIHRDFDPTTGAPLLAPGDSAIHTLFNRAVSRLSVQTAIALAGSESIQQAAAASAAAQTARQEAQAAEQAAQLIKQDVQQVAQEVQAGAQTVAGSVTAATDAASAAVDAANIAGMARDEATVAASEALTAKIDAQAWAATPEDTALSQVPGAYSALHWAKKAEAEANRALTIVDGRGFSGIGDGTATQFTVEGPEAVLNMVAGSGINLNFSAVGHVVTIALDQGLLGNPDGVATLGPDGKVPGDQLPALDYIPVSEKGAAGGVATLDGTGRLSAGQIPSLSINEPFVVSSEAAMLALTAQTGDIAIRTDANRTYILGANNPAILSNWIEMSSAGGVQSVHGRSGTVAAQAGDYSADIVSFTPIGGLAATTVQAALQELATTKLTAAAYTPSDILSKLLTVDGAGSGLDADLLGGQSAAAFASAAHTHSADGITSGILDVARLPVAQNGVADGSSVVRADDTRLSDARAPLPHDHSAANVATWLAYTPANKAGESFTGTVEVTSTSPSFRLRNTNGGVDEKVWDFSYNSATKILYGRSLNDLNASPVHWIEVTRGGTAITSVNFPSGQLQASGQSVWHTGNDGPGSGLDADTVDGFQAAALAKLAGATFTGAVIANGGLTMGGALEAAGQEIRNPKFKAYKEATIDLGNSGTACTIDLSQGNRFRVTLTGNCTFSFVNWPASGTSQSFSLYLRNDGTANRSVVWPAAVDWQSGINPGRSTAANALDLWNFESDNAGSVIVGSLTMKDIR